MSFFGNNSRPDLLKGNNGEDSERTPRASEPRFSSDLPQTQAPEPVPSFGSESRSGSSYGSSSNSAVPTATPPDRCSNVVGAGARWKGSLKVDEDARIDGIFSGDIEAKGTVHVSEGAEVDAKIHAAFVVVAGSFRGEIRAEQKAELMPSSKVSGEVITKTLSVHEGATLDGSVQMTGETARATGTNRNGRNGATADRDAARERPETPATTGGA